MSVLILIRVCLYWNALVCIVCIASMSMCRLVFVCIETIMCKYCTLWYVLIHLLVLTGTVCICMYRNNHVYVLYVVVCIDTFASIDWYRFTIHTNTLHTTIHANTFTWGEKTVSLTDPVLVCIWYVSRYVVACNGMYLAG